MLSDSQKKLLLDSVRTVKDFPKEGVNYKDITTMIAKPACLRMLCDHLAGYYKDKQINAISSIESRGFIFGSILAYNLGLPFIPIRKAGKLPFKTVAQTYDLEYGTDTIEMHQDAFSGLQAPKVLLLDDILATGGTANAAISLIKKTGVECVSACFILTLTALPGERLLKQQLPVYSVLVT